ncbi:MAG: 6-phosphogluconolactonase, partial [Bacteroidales bacterium]|nr:6-phosphogluconolactonase [Bacteroidales bacterium]
MKHFSLPKDGGLIETGLPKDILHGYDKVFTELFQDAYHASEVVANELIAEVNAFVPTDEKPFFKLGLTTGSTPMLLYGILSQAYAEGRVSFRNVEIFSIDEYYPSSKDEMQSRNYRLHHSLVDRIDVGKENVHIPDGSVPQENLSEYCADFDREARNLDLLVIGIGENGQVGFNEAGSSFGSRTRAVILPYASRKRQAHNFNGDIANTPASALTVGIDTMMSARRVILMAWGEKKANAVYRIAEGPQDTMCPATCFQNHPAASLYVDETAGAQLTRIVAPWKIGPCEWTRKFRRKAVVWLCTEVQKPILKLTHEDYLQNSLGELID